MWSSRSRQVTLATAVLSLVSGCAVPMESEAEPLPPPSAYDVLTNRCDGGDGAACVEVGTQYRELGELPLAAAYFRRACDLANPFGCAALARAWDRGEGLERDPAAATSLYVSACLGGHAPSCISAAAGVGAPDSAEFMRRGCTAEPALCRPRPEPSLTGVDPLDQANVVLVMAARRDDLRDCYRRSLAQRLTLRGRVALEIAISGDGRVRAAAIVENIREAPEVGACVLEVIGNTAFAPTTSGELAVIPWRVQFEPER
ncbi:AgmX/PglI C-terminal domain-containing protein [Nannocystis pusilla]|uniref:AgmX/PglI C-terminal domain-containing protein n=1 Tax=Nannocystis pusilla TaxID=889268 RepID=A0ABS7TUQ3_9BACT|nr:AgmX/PglI C-terminal domain-containing protein [Nannocystis pusilla]MBZ5711919.1 AgmX/PglI C-terminal domain-containing protein [Nannocystis pusilla]